MKVLVTGHRGYIGAHLVGLLKEAGHHVTGCDLDLFEGCDWEQLTPPDREVDIREHAPPAAVAGEIGRNELHRFAELHRARRSLFV